MWWLAQIGSVIFMFWYISYHQYPSSIRSTRSTRSKPHRSHRFQRRFGEVTGPSYPDVLPEVRFTAGINMTCVEPDGQVKPAWGVLGAADHGGSSCWRNVGERIMWFPCDSLGEGKIVWDVGLIKFDERWWVLVNWVPESLDSLDMGLGRTTDSAGNWKREYTIETVLDALRREMSGSQARLMDTFQIRMISKYPKPKIQSYCSSR